MAIRIMQNVIFITSSNSQSPSLHSSSNAFSPTSSSSDPDNPSTSDCSNAQSGKVRTQKELMKAVNELKMHLPIERIRGKSNTLSTLKYALRCVKQVRGKLVFFRYEKCKKDLFYLLHLNHIAVYDIFAVAISLITGRIVYISDQAASVLNCKKNVFKNAKFIEFLAPQDAGVFYTFTSPSQLPLWSVCTAAGSPPPDCVLEKSFFCRMSGGWERDGSIQYYPFRMTPYLTNVQRSEDVEDELCCLLIAERVHSGYEAPRIPLDKRIFTTTHTPSCIFQDIDERAVPLLGYLPQDLIGTAVLMHLHPGDRSLMLGIHKKILKHAGQPFDHSPLRFCTHNGEYITIDTSWSSFVNPWSRKVSFIIGRHKVRTGPLNEDIFATPSPGLTEVKMTDSEIQTITEQIHKLLLQPVYKKGSSGYGSLGSNGSYGQFMSIASSSDSNGNEECSRVSPMTFQKLCKDVHLIKNQGQAVFIESRAKRRHKSGNGSIILQSLLNSELRKLYRISKVWIYCDCIVYHSVNHDLFCIYRYLDSCNVPSNVKSKSEPSSNSEDKQKRIPDEKLLSHQTVQTPLNPTKEIPAPLTHLPLPRKAESIVSFTSQCSYRSTIVHVGDKKPQADPEILMEDGLAMADSAAIPTAPLVSVSVNQEKEQYKKRGLTKEVLAAHTQNEEQVFLRKFKELSKLKAFESPCKSYLQERHKGFTGEYGKESLILFFPHPPTQPDTQKTPAPSCCSTPLSVEPQVQGSPPLFQSRCSSPLQLNLLQLEETPMVLEQPETTAFVEENRLCEVCSLDAEIREWTAVLHGVSVFSSDAILFFFKVGSSQLSNTSNYFGSIDSSENDHKSKVRTNSAKNKQFMKCVLQGPFWLTMSNTDEEVMMSYQLPSRDMESILKEDREKLKMMQKNQPRFTEQQKKEISEVHPWIKTGELPKAINLAAPFCCGRNVSGNNSNPLESEVGSVELSEVVESNRGDCHQRLIFSAKEQKPTEMMN
uniref:Period circadian protein homolog 2 n=1 Tax=Callorhinchus milii TaxID=7868 RepID=A0A4W3JC24_CALMI